MLDHVFTDAIGALRDALEKAMLERQAFEERFQTDVLLGDLTWETSYSLPGEGHAAAGPLPTSRSTGRPGRRRAYRSWYIEEEFDEPPHIEIEVVLRIQRLATGPDPARGAAEAAAGESADRHRGARRSGPTIEAATATTSTTSSTPSRSPTRGPTNSTSRPSPTARSSTCTSRPWADGSARRWSASATCR